MDAEELAAMILGNKVSAEEVSFEVDSIADQAGDCRQDREAAAEDLTILSQVCYTKAYRFGDEHGWEWRKLADKIERVIRVLRLPPRPKSPVVFNFNDGQRRLDDFLLKKKPAQVEPEPEEEAEPEPEDDLLDGM